MNRFKKMERKYCELRQIEIRTRINARRVAEIAHMGVAPKAIVAEMPDLCI
jgi:hypothetical protein